MRKYPEIILRQQNSIYTTSDKIFESIEKSFGSSLNNFADLKEMIPEFYSRNPEFLVNWHKMEVTVDTAVSNVEIPEWAKSYDEFCGVLRTALDSDIVSESLHHWIDLIFGCKQNGLEFNNNYLPECFEVNWNEMNSDLKKNSMTVILKEYGIAPSQVFRESHPQRNFKITVVSDFTQENKNKLQKLMIQAQNLTQIHSKEFKAQEKQYKQLLLQETQEKNQEIMELKAKLTELKGLYKKLDQKKDKGKDSEKNIFALTSRKADIHLGNKPKLGSFDQIFK